MSIRKRQSTITQQYSPTIRRRLKPNYLSLSVPGGFITNDHETSTPNPSHQHPENQTSLFPGSFFSLHSIHPSSPTNRNKHEQKLRLTFETFIQNHKKIHTIIDDVDQIIRKRMQAHEDGLLTVVRSQIDRMQADCKKIVHEYNCMIQAKNKETEIYNLKNQVEYFRKAALEYYEENRRLTQENCQLRILMRNKDEVIEELNGAIRRVEKKFLKEKAVSERKDKQLQQGNQSLLKKIQMLTQQSSQKLLKSPQISTKPTIRKSLQKPRHQSFIISSQSLPTNCPQPNPNPKIKQPQQSQPQQKVLLTNTHRYSESKNYFNSIHSNKFRKTRMRTQMGTVNQSTCYGENLGDSTTVKAKNAGKSKSFWKFQPIGSS